MTELSFPVPDDEGRLRLIQDDLEPVVCAAVTQPTRALHAEVARLHGQLFPGRPTLSIERFFHIMRDPRHTLITARIGAVLVGMTSLVRIESFSRTALLFEEFVVDAACRGRGIGKAIDAFLIRWSAASTEATRIEGTVNYENERTWHVHMASGFADRRNRCIILDLSHG